MTDPNPDAEGCARQFGQLLMAVGLLIAACGGLCALFPPRPENGAHEIYFSSAGVGGATAVVGIVTFAVGLLISRIPRE